MKKVRFRQIYREDITFKSTCLKIETENTQRRKLESEDKKIMLHIFWIEKGRTENKKCKISINIQNKIFLRLPA